MVKHLASKKRAKALCLALFLVGLAILSYLNTWWPGIMVVIGIPLAIRQYLLGKRYDVGVTLFVFLGTFVIVQFDISWRILLPVIFTIGAIYIFCKEFLEPEPETEREEDINEEIEEEQHKP